MKISKLAMFSFALSITPIIIYVVEPLINQIINTGSIGFKLTLSLFIFPVLSINSIILARLSATYMINYKLKGQAIAMSAIVLATITFFIAILRIANMTL